MSTLDPHPSSTGDHAGPQAPDSPAFPPEILMRPKLFNEPPRVGEPGESGVSAPSPGPAPSQGSHAALRPHCLDSWCCLLQAVFQVLSACSTASSEFLGHVGELLPSWALTHNTA